jgi:multidrug efflux pump subunit AcrA (membrane-fusion protein)
MSETKIYPKLRFFILSLLFIFLFLGGGVTTFRAFLSLRKPPQRVEFSKPSAAVQILRAKREDYREKLFGYGVVRELRATDVESEVPGLVKWLSPRLEAGLSVTEKEELVKLDERDFQQALASAEAVLAEARINVSSLKMDIATTQKQLAVLRHEWSVASRELARIEDLERSKQIATSALDSQILQTSARERAVIELEWQESSRKSALERAEAEVRLREAQFIKAQNDLARTTICAPYSGKIETRQINLGARVGQGKPVFRIVDTARVEVAVSLGASHFGEVTLASTACLRRHDAGEILWQGKIARIAPTINQIARTFLVYLEMQPEQSAALAPGTFVAAEVDGKVHPGVMVIPRAAFLGDKVFIIKPVPGSKEAIVEELTPVIYRSLTDTVLVRGGIEPGEAVVLTGVDQIGEGSRVYIMAETKNAR